MKSPGHLNYPEHKVLENKPGRRFTVEAGGEVIADSTDVIEVDEDGHPPRLYFPRSDVRMDRLSPSGTTSQCPFKGTAHYFDIRGRGHELRDAVWTYEEPFDEHAALKDRLAFWDDKVREVAIHRA
jgi:uncharacterized protein (DUF427 family)